MISYWIPGDNQDSKKKRHATTPEKNFSSIFQVVMEDGGPGRPFLPTATRDEVAGGLAPSSCASRREEELQAAPTRSPSSSTEGRRRSADKPKEGVGLARPPRETILSSLRQLPAVPRPKVAGSRETAHHQRRRFVSGHSAGLRQGYTVNERGRLEFSRLKDEVKFATATAAVRSALEHRRELLQSLGDAGSRGSVARSFVALVCKDAAKAGGYRLCMRYFGPRLPAPVPWVIDALVQGDTLARGVQEVLQIGTTDHRRSMPSSPFITDGQCCLAVVIVATLRPLPAAHVRPLPAAHVRTTMKEDGTSCSAW